MINCLQKRFDIVVREEDGAYLFYDPKSGDLFTTNRSYCQIWDLCNGFNTEKDIVEALRQKYKKVPEGFEDIIDSSLDYLKFNNLLKSTEDGEDHSLSQRDKDTLSGDIEQPDATSDTPPLNLIHCYVTNRCNLRCRHCWISPEWTLEQINSEFFTL